MKIENKILLFTIEILINFLQLNASPEPWDDEASAMPNFVPFTPRLDLNLGPSGSRPHARQLNTMPEHHGLINLPYVDMLPNPSGRRPNPHVEMHYLNRVIHVLLKKLPDGQYEPKECVFAEGGGGTVPDTDYKKHSDYYVYAIYGQYEYLRVKCVVYVKQANWQDAAEVLGVKLPPKPARASDSTENPRLLDPDETKWFIACMGLEFMIRQQPTGLMTEVTLRTRKNSIPTEKAIRKKKVTTSEVYIGGAYILVFKKKERPLGAVFRPKWWTPKIRAEVMGLPAPTE